MRSSKNLALYREALLLINALSGSDSLTFASSMSALACWQQLKLRTVKLFGASQKAGRVKACTDSTRIASLQR